MPQPSIVVVGSSNTDMIIRVEQIPRTGETVLGGDFMTAAGGKGANQAVGAARAGGRVTFIARVGGDMFGEQALAGFVAKGIDVAHVTRDAAAPTGVALIFVGRKGENCIAVAPGANSRLVPADVERAREKLSGSIVVMQLEVPLETLEAAAELAVAAGAPVILNPAPARELPDSLLRNVSVLTPNETEAEQLTGIKIESLVDAENAAGKLLARGVQAVVLTLGARGAYVASADFKQFVPGFTVEAVDTTAAGDMFNGALAVALGEGKALAEAVRFANAAGAISVTRPGAQPSAPTRAEIEKFLAER
jgi:ribokinase